jgi:hypothetical protein
LIAVTLKLEVGFEIDDGPSVEINARTTEGQVDDPFRKAAVRQSKHYGSLAPHITRSDGGRLSQQRIREGRTHNTEGAVSLLGRRIYHSRMQRHHVTHLVRPRVQIDRRQDRVNQGPEPPSTGPDDADPFDMLNPDPFLRRPRPRDACHSLRPDRRTAGLSEDVSARCFPAGVALLSCSGSYAAGIGLEDMLLTNWCRVFYVQLQGRRDR